VKYTDPDGKASGWNIFSNGFFSPQNIGEPYPRSEFSKQFHLESEAYATLSIILQLVLGPSDQLSKAADILSFMTSAEISNTIVSFSDRKTFIESGKAELLRLDKMISETKDFKYRNFLTSQMDLLTQEIAANESYDALQVNKIAKTVEEYRGFGGKPDCGPYTDTRAISNNGELNKTDYTRAYNKYVESYTPN
jgi:hypothetical protein